MLRDRMMWGAANDPLWSQVYLAARMDGANGSAQMIDETGRVLDPFGTAYLSATQSKFGGVSLSSQSGVSGVKFNMSGMAFSGDFTVEFFAYLTGSGAQNALFDMRESSANYGPVSIYRNAAGQVTVLMTTAAGGWGYTQTVVTPNSQWFHFAITRQGSTVRIFVDGVLLSTVTFAGALMAPLVSNGTIGGLTSGANPAVGYVDFVRVTLGTARYTAAFSAPSKPFPVGRAGTIPTDSVFYFKFNEATGAVVYKNENSVTNGTKIATVANTPAPRGQGIRLAGNGAVATGQLLPASAMSFSVWVNPASVGIRHGIFSDLASGGASSSGWLDLGLNGAALEIGIGNGSTYWLDQTTFAHGMVVGQWMNLCVTITGTTVKIYRNGRLATTLTSTVAYPGTAGPRNATLGRLGDYASGFAFNGDLARPRLFARVLTDAEVAALAQEMNPATDQSWSGLNRGANTSLSVRGRSALVNTTNSAKGVLGRSSGVRQFEFTMTVGATILIGIGNATASLTQFPGQNANSWGYFASDGARYHNNASAAYGSGLAVNDVLGVVIDFSAGTLTFYKNGVSLGVAYSNLAGQTVFPQIGSGTGTATNYGGWLNTGEDGFAYPVGGATPWSQAA